ncbi:class I SAM-dependent methyltransferase [Shewanella sp. AS1]|uniref:class I SAM-dependent methyltransferase n=1 Tax=Shewanella sp. AS1 TaxID=2907626 RepID=UPI001F46AEA8|nr:class I SAM-dependent methyltransferase [Shewanella sp. AS1]MCE9679361.1 class I SAM-dependent methyltransferase [Shewanella sp. AS1]
MERKRSKASPAQLLLQHRQIFQLSADTRVLDLACGSGRNGLWFAEYGAKVTFVDRDLSRLDAIPPNCYSLSFDLEAKHSLPPFDAQFDIVIIFNYLHRPLFEPLKRLIRPGGLIVYETFLTEQANVGRPKNPDFLLHPGELMQVFDSFTPLHYFEGNVGCEQQPCFKAQLIARQTDS